MTRYEYNIARKLARRHRIKLADLPLHVVRDASIAGIDNGVVYDARNMHAPTAKPDWQWRPKTEIEKYDGKKLIVFKKAHCYARDRWDRPYHKMYCVVVLEVSAGTRRQQRYGCGNRRAKCRAASARVLRFETLTGEVIKGKRFAYAGHGRYRKSALFKYELGKIVRPLGRKYDVRFAECSAGIHFFLDRQTAQHYAM